MDLRCLVSFLLPQQQMEFSDEAVLHNCSLCSFSLQAVPKILCAFDQYARNNHNFSEGGTCSLYILLIVIASTSWYMVPVFIILYNISMKIKWKLENLKSKLKSCIASAILEKRTSQERESQHRENTLLYNTIS